MNLILSAIFNVDRRDLQAAIELESKKLIRDNSNFNLAVGVIKNGAEYRKYFGPGKNSAPLDENAIFQIGSLSKLFTAETFESLSLSGALNKNATVAEILGNHYPVHKKVAAITLNQLATHTSGFPKDPHSFVKKVEDRVGKSEVLKNPFSYLSVDDVFNYLKIPTDHKIPGRFEYSNFGMGLLGHLMAIRLGQPFEKLVKTQVLDPLEMKDTAIHLTSEQNLRVIPGYDEKGERSPAWTFGALDGAGAFYSTLKDMTAFLKHHLTSKNKIGWMRSTFMDRILGNKHVYWHNGQVGGYSAYIAVDQTHHFGIALLANQSMNLTFFGALLTLLVRTQSWKK